MLKEEALRDYPATATWLNYDDVATLQGNIALVINPYDGATAKMLQDKYAFLHCEGRSGQLWLPVLPVLPL